MESRIQAAQAAMAHNKASLMSMKFKLRQYGMGENYVIPNAEAILEKAKNYLVGYCDWQHDAASLMALPQDEREVILNYALGRACEDVGFSLFGMRLIVAR